MTNSRAYQRAYNNQRRARLRKRGRCVVCGKPRRAGIAANGEAYSRCQRCMDLQAKYTTASRQRRHRRGRCLTCPRRMKGRSWQCSRCLGVRHGRQQRREAA